MTGFKKDDGRFKAYSTNSRLRSSGPPSCLLPGVSTLARESWSAHARELKLQEEGKMAAPSTIVRGLFKKNSRKQSKIQKKWDPYPNHTISDFVL